ncbi:MAG: hypothetical protein AAGF77_14885 [Bacteroidota bacterium]
MKKNIIELLLFIELDHWDLAHNRFERFQRQFTALLKKTGEQRVLTFVSLVKSSYEQPGKVTPEALDDMVKSSFTYVGRDKEDIFVLSFYAWLKARIEKRALYEVTLELVSLA